MSGAGFVVYAHDHRGWGKSEGPTTLRLYEGRFHHLLDDVGKESVLRDILQ